MRARALASLTVVAALLGGCGGSGVTPGAADGGAALPTPMASFSSAVEATVAELRAAVEAVGYSLDLELAPFRPSEPQGLVTTPRAVLRARLADPEAGHVIVYEAGDAGAAVTLAQELARYLGSGFGQTNYPIDARSAVGVLGRTVIFAWWSPERSDDREAEGAVFEAFDSVGQDVPVVR